jgi:hypothetical protein
MAKAPAAAFNVASFKTFNAFQKGGAAYVADYLERGNQLSKVVLAAAVLDVIRSPSARIDAVVEGAFAFLSVNGDTLKNYKSQLRGALGFAIKQALVPSMVAGDTEANVLAKVEVFCTKYTLRGLYDEARKPAVAKAEERKAEREVKAVRAEQDARTAFGVEASTVADLKAAPLMALIGQWVKAADEGNVMAQQVMAALEAQLFEARMKREEGEEAQAA